MHFQLLIELPCVNVGLSILFPLKFAVWNDSVNKITFQVRILLYNSSFSVEWIVVESTHILKLMAVVNSLLTVQFSIGHFSLVVWSIGSAQETLSHQLSFGKLSNQNIPILAVELSPSLWASELCYKKKYFRNLAQVHTSFIIDFFWAEDPVKLFKERFWGQKIVTFNRDKITKLLRNGWSLNWIF